jgi:hypothetical protein
VSSYLPALRRFWWLVAIGVLFAAIAGAAAIYNLPSFEQRDKPVYTATARMLVTGADAPYFRTSVTRTTGGSAVDTPGGNVGVTTTTSPPDVTIYTRAANTFPPLVESDQVRAERERRFGPEPEGTISIGANAIYQVATPSRFRLSEVPVIQVFGTATTPSAAIAITQQTADAFMSWLRKQQNAASVPARQRILIQEIQQPNEAIPSRTASRSLAFLVFVAVVLAFGFLAVVLDRLSPRESNELGGVVGTIGGAAEDEADAAAMPAAAAAGGVPAAARRTLHRYPGRPGNAPPVPVATASGGDSERAKKPTKRD